MRSLNMASTIAIKLGLVSLGFWIIISPQEFKNMVDTINSPYGTLSDTSIAIPGLLSLPDTAQVEIESGWPEAIWFLPDTVQGIDISRYQKQLTNSLEPSDSLTFVLVKATEGKDHTDPMFAINWHNLKEAGFVVGGYHFYSTGSSPISQAQFFCRTLGPLEVYDLPPVVDFEESSIKSRPKKSKAKVIEELATFLEYMETCSGKIPIIYTGADMYKRYFDNVAFYRYPIWIANYRDNGWAIPSDYPQFDFPYDFWQYSPEFMVNGIRVNADLFHGNIDDFITFLEVNTH